MQSLLEPKALLWAPRGTWAGACGAEGRGPQPALGTLQALPARFTKGKQVPVAQPGAHTGPQPQGWGSPDCRHSTNGHVSRLAVEGLDVKRPGPGVPGNAPHA